MKKTTRQIMKEVMIQALEQYFKKSGIAQILVKLYKQSLIEVKRTKQQVAQPKKQKVTNILQSNKKAMSKVQQMRQAEDPRTYMQDEDSNPIKIATSTRPGMGLQSKLNQNIDPISNEGSSILDEPLPAFLANGLMKAKKNAKR